MNSQECSIGRVAEFDMRNTFSLVLSIVAPWKNALTLLIEVEMAKKVEAYIKLQVPAGKANPSPPVGPALGQHGVNIMEFCKAFNAKTQDTGRWYANVPVIITVYGDRSFTFETKTPPASVLLKKVLKLKKGSGRPNTEKVGTVTREQLLEIAKVKEPDLTAADEDAAIRTIAGSARSMGLNVEGVE